MSTRSDADIAETEFCLDPSGDVRMAEEGESDEEWLKMKKNVEEGEDDKIRDCTKERSVNLWS